MSLEERVKSEPHEGSSYRVSTDKLQIDVHRGGVVTWRYPGP